MAHRSIHYEAAFEDYLRSQGRPYVAVDEAKKAIFSDTPVKGFDFIVYSDNGPNLLVDVKGRKFPARPDARGCRPWENWITENDAHGLSEWEKVFGQGFRAVLVFAYWIQGPPHSCPFRDIHLFKDKHYAFLGVGLGDYLAASRQRSRRWGTLTVGPSAFRKLAGDIFLFF